MLDLSEIFQDDKHQPFLWKGNTKYCAVLVHGFPGTPSEMRSVAEVLHSYGWTVHALLLPGFGIEINSLADKTYDEWLSSVITVIKQHKQTYEKVILVGLSMGGALSIQASVTSNVDYLLLFAPFWKFDHILWRMLPIIKHIIPSFKPFRIFRPALNDPEVIQEIKENFPSADLEDVKHMSISTNMINQIRIAGIHARESVEHINIPTMIIQGIQDTVVQPELTQELVDNMTTKVNYVVIDGEHNLTDADDEIQWENVKTLIHQFATNVEQENF